MSELMVMYGLMTMSVTVGVGSLIYMGVAK